MQEYRLVLRTVNSTGSPDGSVMDAVAAVAQLNDFYLSQGYKILSVSFVGAVKVGDGVQDGLSFAYHLVRDVPEPSATKKD